MKEGDNWQWLRDCALPQMRQDGIIDESQTTRISAYCTTRNAALLASNKDISVSTLLAALLASFLFGCGIIMLFAWNWDMLPRAVRVTAALTPLLLASLFCTYVIARDKPPLWREPAGILFAAGTATAIAMVSQIYNCKGNFNDFMLALLFISALAIPLLRNTALAFCVLLLLPATVRWSGEDALLRNFVLPLLLALIPALHLLHSNRQTHSMPLLRAQSSVLFYASLVTPLILARAGTEVESALSIMSSAVFLLWWRRSCSDSSPVGTAGRSHLLPMASFAVSTLICIHACRGGDLNMNAGLTAILLALPVIPLLYLHRSPRTLDWPYAAIFIAGLLQLLLRLTPYGIYSGSILLASAILIGGWLLVGGIRCKSIICILHGWGLLLALALHQFAWSPWSLLSRAVGFIICGAITMLLVIKLRRLKNTATASQDKGDN